MRRSIANRIIGRTSRRRASRGRCWPAAMAGALVLGVGVSAANATILFQDTFDRPDNVDINAGTAGQSGSVTVGTPTYIRPSAHTDGPPEQTFYQPAEITNGTLKLYPDTPPWVATQNDGSYESAVAPDYNFAGQAVLDAGGFVVELDFQNQLMISVGMKGRGYAGTDYNNIDHGSNGEPFSILLSPDDDEDTVTVDTAGYHLSNTSDTVASTQTWHHVRLAIQTTSFANTESTNGTAQVWIDGQLTAIGPNGETSRTFDWQSNQRAAGDNYIQLARLPANAAYVDNFTISTIPEPSSGALALLALGGLVMLPRRRKVASW